MRSAVVILWCASVGFGQGLTATGPDPASVPLGKASVVVLTVEAAAKDVTLGPLPRIDGLEVSARRPEQRTEQVTVDGQLALVMRTSITITFEPRRAGTFEIPPLSVDVRGRTVKSAPLAVDAVSDPLAERHGFVEVIPERATTWVRDPLAVTVRFGFEQGFLDGNVIQLFRRTLDVPAQVGVDWLAELPGARALSAVAPDGPRQTCVVNDEMRSVRRVADRVVGGKTFRVLELSSRWLPENAGVLSFSEPWMRFAYATQFRSDFLSGRVPTDRNEVVIAGDRAQVTVRPLPEVGRPAAFTGLVGTFRVTARSERAALIVGEPFKLMLRIAGAGVLDHVVPPRVDDLPGFHVLGVIRGPDSSPGSVEFVYDVAPLDAELRQIPGIPFAFFDPRPPAAYRTIRTRPIDVTIAAGAGAHPAVTGSDPSDLRPRPGIDDIHGLRHQDAPSAASAPVTDQAVFAGVWGPWVLGLLVLAGTRVFSRQAGVTDARHRLGAGRRFFAQTERSVPAVTDSLIEYLGTRLGCSWSAVIGPDLPSRLGKVGVPDEVARKAGDLVERLVAVQYGGAPPAEPYGAAGAVVDAIEEALAGDVS